MKKIALFGGSFNPPGIHHQKIAYIVSQLYDETIIYPCGFRPDKETLGTVTTQDREKMVKLAFGNIPNCRIDFTDLELNKYDDNFTYTTTHELDLRFSKEYEVWNVFGSDLFVGGADGKSVIQRDWVYGKELWERANFVIFNREGYPINKDDLPPKSKLLDVSIEGSSSVIRELYFKKTLVIPKEVDQYIEEHQLYR